MKNVVQISQITEKSMQNIYPTIVGVVESELYDLDCNIVEGFFFFRKHLVSLLNDELNSKTNAFLKKR